jgi:hypothetical protein
LFPRFHIIRLDANEVLGSVTATTYGRETWVGDGHIGYLMAAGKFIVGRWHTQGDSWGFIPGDSGLIEILRPNTEWIILDGYWGERAELILDANRQWQKATYEGSDHNHCAICWETLGKDGQEDGYVSQDARWICSRCYESYVHPRSLEFIPRIESQ